MSEGSRYLLSSYLPHLSLNRHQCDEGRPSCRRCVRRGEVCTGYRDTISLSFRDETEKAARTRLRRRASHQSLPERVTSSEASTISGLCLEDPSDLSTTERHGLNFPASFPWAKSVPEALVPSAEDQAVSQFFEKFVMYPCNHSSSPGFLEHLPNLLGEAKLEGRFALRWAVRAAAFASLSNDQSNAVLGNKALQCYGLALSALADSLAEPGVAPDDNILMTVVVLDLFEVRFRKTL